LPGDIAAQLVDSNDKNIPSLAEGALKKDQDSPVEPTSSIPPEKFPPTSPKEGIDDAFSKDQGDRFKAENEKTSEVKPDNKTLGYKN